MKYRHRSILIISYMLFITLMLIMSMSCERLLPIQLENRTDMVLTIYVEGHEEGDVEPNKSINIKGVTTAMSDIFVEAKNRDGELIFSKEFGFDELHDSDWKIIVSLPSADK